MFCKECGTQLADDSKFCPNCGKEVTGIVSVENVGSDLPKKKPIVIIAVGAILACIIAMGIFFMVGNQTEKNTDNEITESISDTETYEITLSAGTYTNESNSITVAKSVDGEYSFNLFAYDDIGEYFFLAGSIDNDNGNYLGIILEDESGNFIDKRFSITPSDGDIVISSDDDSLSFICMKYQYSYEVDALEKDVSEYEIIDIPLKEGYYGYLDNDTEYMLAINPDSTFMINVVGASSPILYGEGDYYYIGNDAYKAYITVCDYDSMNNQAIGISMIDENTLLLSAQYEKLNNAVQGTYQYAGSSPADVENLKFGNDAISNSGTLSEIEGRIPYVPVIANNIGKYVENTYDLSSFMETDIGTRGIDLDYCKMQGVTTYLSYNDGLLIGVKDNIVVFEKIEMEEAEKRVPIDEFDLPEEFNSIDPYMCRDGTSVLYCLACELENAYYILEILNAGTNFFVVNVFIVSDLQYCSLLSIYEPIY